LPDRFSDVAVLLGCGYAVGAHSHGQELGALACILALITAYVRALGAAAGAGQCFLGPMAKPHRMAIVTVACASAAVLAIWDLDRAVLQLALAVLILGCVVTLWRRTCWIVRHLEAR
jgi:phosphatidylglycerophosphate synthase